MTANEVYHYYYHQWLAKVESILLSLGFNSESIQYRGNRKIYTPTLDGSEIVLIEEFELDGQLLARFSGNGVCYCQEFFAT